MKKDWYSAQRCVLSDSFPVDKSNKYLAQISSSYHGLEYLLDDLTLSKHQCALFQAKANIEASEQSQLIWSPKYIDEQILVFLKFKKNRCRVFMNIAKYFYQMNFFWS